MRAVIQRVSQAEVRIAGREVGRIGRGLLVLLGVAEGDSLDDGLATAGRIARLRIFPDGAGRMDLSVLDCGLEVLVVSQFTLLAELAGNRPSFTRAARAEPARSLYLVLVAELARLLGRPVATGEFGADMQVALTNDGPVTIIMESRKGQAPPGPGPAVD